MANCSVSSFELSDNDVQNLAQIIVCKLEYYKTHTSPFQKDYICSLRTIVGLGYTAALASGRGCLCKEYLDIFVGSDIDNENYFKEYIANAIAKIIQIALISFRSLNIPKYFESFVDAAGIMLNVIALCETDINYDREAVRLLGIIAHGSRKI